MSENRPLGSSASDAVSGHALPHDPVGRLLKIGAVCAETGLSRATIYRLMAETRNPFPKPLKIGTSSRWSFVEIIEWKMRALAERDR